ncbi:MAG: hypothetical protein ACYTAN_18810, partial [Planctomycetota bacterium]
MAKEAKRSNGKARNKANGKARKRVPPLLSDRPLRRTKDWEGDEDFGLVILPTPKLERETDIARYLIEELPEWVDAISGALNTDRRYNLTSALLWDLRLIVQVVGYTLKDRRVPFIRRNEVGGERRMIADAVSRCIPDTTERPDAIRFLELL